MTSSHSEMKSIWYLVGLLLLAMGTVITAAGVYHLFTPPAESPVLFHLHPDLWWGLVMVASGATFYFTSRRGSR
jgi:hypothetical protein